MKLISKRKRCQSTINFKYKYKMCSDTIYLTAFITWLWYPYAFTNKTIFRIAVVALARHVGKLRQLLSGSGHGQHPG